VSVTAPPGLSPPDAPSVLVCDLGAANLKLWCSRTGDVASAPTGSAYTPDDLCRDVARLSADWPVDRLTLGVPTGVVHGRCYSEPHNIGRGWVDFDVETAFAVPAKILNDAVMQAVGSYEGGVMLFLGLGTGLGTSLVHDGHPVGLEIQHLPYRDGLSFEDWTGTRGIERFGLAVWRHAVADVVRRMKDATVADYVVLGGGNLRHLEELPPHCRRGSNANAFIGGWRLWAGPEANLAPSSAPAP
jgi:polyphosphate glucokinase